jgi:ABC-type antimicrobial peptide transport system permease subunit
MIQHYLKVAFRNLWKYKNQTLVSVVGLAVGFVCFAMSALWIRYEMTYDSFHKNADRMYCVYQQNKLSANLIGGYTPHSLAEHLKSVFPEIANATCVSSINIGLKYEGVSHNAVLLDIDSSFFSMFDVKIVEGNMDFAIPGNKKIAITREKAIQMFGNESPVGKKITMNTEYEICAVVTGLPKHSNYLFDFLRPMTTTWAVSYGRTVIEVIPNIDMETLKKKLSELDVEIKPWNTRMSINTTFIPITSVRYTDFSVIRGVKFQHIIIFAIAGLLLILCTLFNYLTLFVSRFRMRQRELALRVVYGASGRSLFAMLSVEFLISLIVALIFGLLLINIVISPFRAVSDVKLELSTIYFESIVYIAVIITVALAIFFLTLVFFRRRTLNASIRGNKKILRKTSIVFQLIISIVFAFCTLIILKQMYYLHNIADLGFSFKNSGVTSINIKSEEIAVLNDKIKQIPEIKETLSEYIPLLPRNMNMAKSIDDWDDKHEDAQKEVTVIVNEISEKYMKFYELELIEGESLKDDDDKKYVLINESAAKAFGWYKSTGKSFGYNNMYVVKGVIKNIYSSSPTITPEPAMYNLTRRNFHRSYIMFKYNEGSWKTCIEKIRKIVEKEFPNQYYVCYNAEEEYDKYLKSENTLLAILTIVSLVCLIVCVFGFVSMVSLTCEERRKEIAIRKINGATIKDILDIFFKEHLTLLAIGALIAFPTGYIIMKPWLENYVIQTEMSAWVYLSILLALIMVIVMCVGGRVYKTSRENPVNAINR